MPDRVLLPVTPNGARTDQPSYNTVGPSGGPTTLENVQPITVSPSKVLDISDVSPTKLTGHTIGQPSLASAQQPPKRAHFNKLGELVDSIMIDDQSSTQGKQEALKKLFLAFLAQSVTEQSFVHASYRIKKGDPLGRVFYRKWKGKFLTRAPECKEYVAPGLSCSCAKCVECTKESMVRKSGQGRPKSDADPTTSAQAQSRIPYVAQKRRTNVGL